MFFSDWLQRREMLSLNKVSLIDALNDDQPITYVNDTAPRALLYSQEFSSQVDALRPHLSSVEHFIGLDRVTSDQDLHWPTERSN